MSRICYQCLSLAILDLLYLLLFLCNFFMVKKKNLIDNLKKLLEKKKKIMSVGPNRILQSRNPVIFGIPLPMILKT